MNGVIIFTNYYYVITFSPGQQVRQEVLLNKLITFGLL